MSDQSKIKAKIAALIAKAKSTEHEAEAEAFMAKAFQLLQDHQIDMGDLLDADDAVIRDASFTMAASSHKWNRELYRALGKLYGCDSCLFEGYGPDKKGNYRKTYRQELVGRESAIVTTQLMYPWICDQIRAHAKTIARSTGMSEQGQAKRVAAALISRIWRLYREQGANNQQAPATAVAKNALVALDRVKQVAAEVWGTDLTTHRSRASVSDGLSRAAANSIGLHRQTGGGSTLRLK